MKFTLEIELGKEAMQSADDVANLLMRTAEKLDGAWWQEDCHGALNLSGKLHDLNGNTVGSWSVTG